MDNPPTPTPLPPTPTVAPDANRADNVPSSWQGAFKLYAFSKAAIMVNIKPVIGLLLLQIVVLGVVSTVEEGTPAYTITSLASTLISVWLSIAMTVLMIAGVKNIKKSFGESLQESGRFYISYFLLGILTGIIAVASFVLFIIPFFIIVPRLVLAEYYLVNENMGVIDSLKASWNATQNHTGKVWGVIGVTILMALIAITIIGIPIAIYLLVMYSAAFVVLYFYLKQNEAPATAPIEGPSVNDSPAGPSV